MKKMNKGTIGVLLALLICMSATLVMAQPTPFVVNGWVNDSSGSPVNDPNVVVTNTNTGEEFVVETAAGSDYYIATTCSLNVSAGHALSFDVDGVTAATHPVTPDEMDGGGFEQNLTATPAGVCGDVNGDTKVNIGDVIRLANHVGFPADPRYYPVDDNLADVNNDNKVNIGDVIRLANHVGFPVDPRYTPICG